MTESAAREKRLSLYKILHIPTGLFWKPSTSGNKKNLSKNGKVYHSKPNIESYLRHRGKLSYTDYEKYKERWGISEREISVPTNLKDWKIIELKTEAL